MSQHVRADELRPVDADFRLSGCEMLLFFFFDLLLFLVCVCAQARADLLTQAIFVKPLITAAVL